jgi:hypothetical protein
MDIKIFEDAQELGKAAGSTTAQLIREAISNNGAANVILATGTSQFETLKQLISEPKPNQPKKLVQVLIVMLIFYLSSCDVQRRNSRAQTIMISLLPKGLESLT